MKTSIGVVGATGTVGSKLVALLAKKENVSTYALVRDLNRFKNMNVNNVEVKHFDFSILNKNSIHGIEKIFWLVPNIDASVETKWFDIIKSSSVKHIVLLSSIFPDIFDMRSSEILIEKSGIPYTILRPNTFMQNFNTAEKDSIINNNAFCYPANLGKTSFIDIRDIAEAAGTILLSNDHINKIYTLTGDEALNYYQVAEILSKECHKTISYIDTWTHPELETKRHENETVWQKFFSGVRSGLFSEITKDLPLLLKRPAIKFKQYVSDYWKV